MTMTSELTTLQRNEQMVERYAAGETLESIGLSYGVTRERGAPNCQQARRSEC